MKRGRVVERTIIRIVVILLVVVASCASLALLGMLAFAGKNQELNFESMRLALKRGMPPDESMRRLGVSPISESHDGSGKSTVVVSESGIGSLFVPQRNISLVFENGELRQVYIETVFQAGESNVTLF